MSVARLIPGLVIFVLVAACEESPEEPPPRPTAASTRARDSARPIGEATVTPNRGDESKRALIWDAPSGWKEQPSRSRMRQATYRVPDAGGDAEDARMVVYYFGPNSGGGVEANMSRWRDQFTGVDDSAVERSTQIVHGLRQHLLSIERGTFASGMARGPKAPKSDFGLLAAIVESPSGHYFFKLTGPSDTVRSQHDSFMKFLDSVRLAPRRHAP